jgi:glycosyltransferase involved in cell wall biosynthesis
MKNKTKSVTVVVPTKNSERTLEACLYSISHQNYEHIEIIVIDNHSTDSTKKVAIKFTDKFYTKGPERSVQRNYGVSKANGDYLLFIDSDMVLDKNVVSECLRKINDDQALMA